MTPIKTKAGMVVFIRPDPYNHGNWDVVYKNALMPGWSEQEIHWMPNKRTALWLMKALVKAWGGREE